MTTTPATAARLAKVRECIAGAADELYAIARDMPDAQRGMALTAAANNVRAAEHDLARLIGKPVREAALEG